MTKHHIVTHEFDILIDKIHFCRFSRLNFSRSDKQWYYAHLPLKLTNAGFEPSQLT